MLKFKGIKRRAKINKTTSYHAQALKRGLQILGYLRVSSKKTESLGSLHKITGLPKSTILRLLEILENHNYVVKIDDQNFYRLCGAIINLASAYDQTSSISSGQYHF